MTAQEYIAQLLKLRAINADTQRRIDALSAQLDSLLQEKARESENLKSGQAEYERVETEAAAHPELTSGMAYSESMAPVHMFVNGKFCTATPTHLVPDAAPAHAPEAPAAPPA